MEYRYINSTTGYLQSMLFAYNDQKIIDKINMILNNYILSNKKFSKHAKACEASRGHISHFPLTGLYISELANICHGIHRQAVT